VVLVAPFRASALPRRASATRCFRASALLPRARQCGRRRPRSRELGQFRAELGAELMPRAR